MNVITGGRMSGSDPSEAAKAALRAPAPPRARHVFPKGATPPRGQVHVRDENGPVDRSVRQRAEDEPPREVGCGLAWCERTRPDHWAPRECNCQPLGGYSQQDPGHVDESQHHKVEGWIVKHW